jgi:hypothetical protein
VAGKVTRPTEPLAHQHPVAQRPHLPGVRSHGFEVRQEASGLRPFPRLGRLWGSGWAAAGLLLGSGGGYLVRT